MNDTNTSPEYPNTTGSIPTHVNPLSEQSCDTETTEIPAIINEPANRGCAPGNETVGYLAAEISRLRSHNQSLHQQIDNWQDSVAQCQRNIEWYQSLLCKVGEFCGTAVYLDNDGMAHSEMFLSKIPEVIRELFIQHAQNAAALSEWLDYMESRGRSTFGMYNATTIAACAMSHITRLEHKLKGTEGVADDFKTKWWDTRRQVGGLEDTNSGLTIKVLKLEEEVSLLNAANDDLSKMLQDKMQTEKIQQDTIEAQSIQLDEAKGYLRELSKFIHEKHPEEVALIKETMQAVQAAQLEQAEIRKAEMAVQPSMPNLRFHPGRIPGLKEALSAQQASINTAMATMPAVPEDDNQADPLLATSPEAITPPEGYVLLTLEQLKTEVLPLGTKFYSKYPKAWKESRYCGRKLPTCCKGIAYAAPLNTTPTKTSNEPTL